jgi:hypothetical protein
VTCIIEYSSVLTTANTHEQAREGETKFTGTEHIQIVKGWA